MAVSVESNFLKTNSSSFVPAASQGVNSHVQLLPLWAVQTQESISTVPEISVRPVSGDVRRWLGTSELGFQLLQLLPCVPAACRGEGQSQGPEGAQQKAPYSPHQRHPLDKLSSQEAPL